MTEVYKADRTEVLLFIYGYLLFYITNRSVHTYIPVATYHGN